VVRSHLCLRVLSDSIGAMAIFSTIPRRTAPHLVIWPSTILWSPLSRVSRLYSSTSRPSQRSWQPEAIKVALDGQKSRPVATEGPTAEGRPELVYFDGPGRAQLARLAFAAGGVDYTDTRVTQEQWPTVKHDPNGMPAKLFGSMPIIKHGDVLIAQSIAVAQYAADLGINSAPGPTDEQRGLDMMMLGAHADLQSAMYKCLFGDDDSKAKGKEMLAGKVAPILEGIERQYKSEGPYLYSPESAGPTLGDLALVDVVASPFPGLRALGFDLAPFKKVIRCVEACQKCSRGTLAAYLASAGMA